MPLKCKQINNIVFININEKSLSKVNNKVKSKYTK